MLQPPLSLLLGVACEDDDAGPKVPVGVGVVPALAPFVGTVTSAPPANTGPSPPFSMSWFGGVQDSVHAVAVVPPPGEMIAPPEVGAQSQVHVDGQSESTLHELVVTCSHVFHLRATHVLPGWQMLGIGGSLQPASLWHVGIGGFGIPEQGMRSAVA
jgi:hypothetical protein